MSEDEFAAFAESKPLRKEFMLAMGRQGFPEKDMNAALDRMRRTYVRMSQTIEASGGPWLLGRDITLADVSGDARARAHGRSRARPHVGRHAGRAALVRGDPRTSRVQADVLFRIATDREISAFEEGKGLVIRSPFLESATMALPSTG